MSAPMSKGDGNTMPCGLRQKLLIRSAQRATTPSFLRWSTRTRSHYVSLDSGDMTEKRLHLLDSEGRRDFDAINWR